MRFVLLPILAVLTSPADVGPSFVAPEWLAGYWLSCEGGAQTVEAWISDGSGSLVGVNQSAGAFEHLRIATIAGDLAYISSPNGAPPTEFKLKEQTKNSAIFENPSHDFPQRLTYVRRGETLLARIEGVVGGKTESAEWRFKSAPIGTTCK